MEDHALDRLLVSATKPFQRAVRFLRLTGCRLSELCRAAWTDVDLETGILIVHQHKSQARTGRPKMVVLLPQAVDLLRD